jgi:HEPN domain-containing protein
MNDETKHAVDQWLVRANVDWRTVEILSSHGEGPPETICFHCQQYVEKLLKALLTKHNIEAPRTHDVRRLVQLGVRFVPQLSALLEPADLLTEHAAAMRYPDEWRNLEPDEVTQMIALARQFAAIVMPALVDPQT